MGWVGRIWQRTGGAWYALPRWKPGHAAALVLLGWYLMMPTQPLSQSAQDSEGWSGHLAHLIRPPAPFADWKILHACDSVKEWEEVRKKEFSPESIVDFEKIISRATESPKNGDQREDNGRVVEKGLTKAMRQVRCIASDDPRLAR